MVPLAEILAKWAKENPNSKSIWKMVGEVGPRRFWMVELPRGDLPVRFIYEFADDVFSADEGEWLNPIPLERLKFWYYCQRDYDEW